jgi:alpha-L-fucosidase 2
VPLVNRYWLHNFASMHNAKKLFNTDISGGMPSVLIKMLVASDPGVVRLFPARPAAWPKGTIEGVLCRGQIEIKSLSWDGKTIQATLRSAKKQDIDLFAPAEILNCAVKKGAAGITTMADAKGRKLSLPAGQDVTVELALK